MPLATPYRILWTNLLLAAFFAAGCTAPLFRGQSPETSEVGEIMELSNREFETQLVGDLAIPWGLNWLKVEGVALVTNLPNTGSDPAPSPLRDKLIREMQTHDVKQYNKALASNDTSMVVVRGFIPPAAQKGDLFDVEVQIPPRSTTSDLADGWLMQCRLRELQLLDTYREGHVSALASGSILTDAVFQSSDQRIAKTRGRIAGGGVVQKPRILGLAISNEHSSVRTSALIGKAINERFHHYDRGKKQGVANPKRDNLIELAVHPRYRNNLGRYIRVVRSIAVSEMPGERVARLSTLQRMLFEPTTAERAALQLEAIGKDGKVILREGLTSGDPQVRFYSAEALAYLDEPSAAESLRWASESERAFRWRALTALAAMDAYEAQEALAQLMEVSSAETRYGAFRALRERNPRDPLVRGEIVDSKFGFHVIPSDSEPLIHFSRSRRPEICVFGNDVQLRPPAFLFAGDNILIKELDRGQVRMSSFRPGEEDEIRECSNDLSEIIHNIAGLGGSYADVMNCLQTAKAEGYLDARIEVDAIPQSNRRYERRADGNEDALDDAGPSVANPIPEMFSDQLSRVRQASAESEIDSGEDFDIVEDERTEPGFLDKMTRWFFE